MSIAIRRPSPNAMSARGGTGAFNRALAWLGGFLATGAAVATAAFLAVFAAAAVAVIAVFVSVLVFLTGLAFRARRTAHARSRLPGVIEARKVGHSWVAYSWDQR
jgi:heme/copper-type cytochrome/quinol oxidase subunit 2